MTNNPTGEALDAREAKPPKTEREEAAYIAGRQDERLLCELFLAGTGVKLPEYDFVENADIAATAYQRGVDEDVATVERVARAIFRSDFHPEEDDEGIEVLWIEWREDRERAIKHARAAIRALKSREASK